MKSAFRKIPELRTGKYLQKFYKSVSVRESSTGFHVLLDGRSIRTPERNLLNVPTYGHAAAIATEWHCQKRVINPYKMPLMSSAAIDMEVTGIRQQLIERLCQFLQNDGLWEHGQERSEYQDQILNPVQEYIRDKYHIELQTCTDFETPDLKDHDILRLRRFCKTVDNYQLVALEAVTAAAKSTGIALSLLDGIIDVDYAIQCARVEEDIQIYENGRVEAHDLEEEYLRFVFSAAKVLVELKGEGQVRIQGLFRIL